ncbi:MAG TPA: Blp family class II bacteriocin [Bacteroides graminisolvens]|nr:Blp family class II bacteriocin [Bacteroides graminisolvens]
MKTLSFEQMENVEGGKRASQSACRAMNVVAYVAGIGSFFGVPGALIFGPTAVVVGAASLAFC